MKAAFYIGVSKGWPGYIDIAIKAALHGNYSHVEILFEPKDQVEQYLPDQCAPTKDGKLWCASSSMMDIMPSWSPRAGKLGGVRFKQINTNTNNWVVLDLPLDAQFAAKWFKDNQGAPYAIKGTLSHVLAFLQNTPGTINCTHAVGAALKISAPQRFDPCSFYVLLETFLSHLASREP